MSLDEFTEFLRLTMTAAAGVCRNGAIAYLCMDWRHLREVLHAGHEVFTELKNICVWAKTNGGMGTFYRSQHEIVLVWKVGTAPHTNNFGLGDKGRYRTNVWTYPGVNTFKSDRMEEITSHPTVKPVALVSDAIRDVSNRGEIVLDVFGGSGTTLIAAEAEKRAQAVGYGKPPVDHRFKKGVSGNPRGRPIKPERARSLRQLNSDILKSANMEHLIITNGKEERVPIIELMLRQLFVMGTKGNMKALECALSLYQSALSHNVNLNRVFHNVLEDQELQAVMKGNSPPNSEVFKRRNYWRKRSQKL